MSKQSTHPAQLAAESDLIKLTREFESLRSQLEANAESEDNLMNEMCAANKQIAHLQRQRRVLRAQLENVKELLHR